GTITITADVSSPTGGTFVNAGLLSKTTTTGTTTLNGPLVNTGKLNVQSGAISLAGGHTLTNGTLNIGISNVTSFGSVTFSGAAALTGTLSANFNAGFLPAVNDSWQIINYTSPSGVFTQTNLPPIAVWQVTTNATSLTIKVLKLVPQMSWPAPADIVYGTALSGSQLDATATWNGSAVAGTFTYNPPSGTVLDSGSNQTLSVSFAPSDPTTYISVTTNVTINVQMAPLSITASNLSKTYGQNFSFAGTEFTTSGLTNGDTVTSASLASAGAISNAPVSGSPYAITITNALGDAGLTNYSITYTNGLLTVGKAMLTITAASTNKIAGETWTFAGTEFTASGLQNGETIGTVTLTSAGAASSASPGPYSIVPSAPVGGTFSQGNYTNQFVDGTLTVLGTPDLTLTLLGDQYVLTFPSVSGQIYQLQSTTNLALAGWSSLGGPISGTGGIVNVTNTIASPQSFFELQITP
ncbi:MAG: MBG domain-containing protein, partial [Limisphaerales bacterium]